MTIIRILIKKTFDKIYWHFAPTQKTMNMIILITIIIDKVGTRTLKAH